MSAAGPRPDPRPQPPALAAFLRGVERRGAVLAELQCGDDAVGDRALAAAMRRFRDEAARLPMADWPQRFWAGLLARPELRQHRQVALELETTDRLSRLGSGPRAALLLRVAAGLDEAEAAAVLGVTPEACRLALQRALPRHANGRADPDAWQRLRELVHRRIKNLPPQRLARLGQMREAALADPSPRLAAARARAHRPDWLSPALWGAFGLCAVLLAATFIWPERFVRRADGALRPDAPASRYDHVAALVSHRDFELLADPEGMELAQDLAFHSWLATRDLDAEPEADDTGGLAQAPPAVPTPLVDADTGPVEAAVVETLHEPH